MTGYSPEVSNFDGYFSNSNGSSVTNADSSRAVVLTSFGWVFSSLFWSIFHIFLYNDQSFSLKSWTSSTGYFSNSTDSSVTNSGSLQAVVLTSFGWVVSLLLWSIFPRFLYNEGWFFMKSWLSSTGYFSNSTGSSVTTWRSVLPLSFIHCVWWWEEALSLDGILEHWEGPNFHSSLVFGGSTGFFFVHSRGPGRGEMIVKWSVGGIIEVCHLFQNVIKL